MPRRRALPAPRFVSVRLLLRPEQLALLDDLARALDEDRNRVLVHGLVYLGTALDMFVGDPALISRAIDLPAIAPA